MTKHLSVNIGVINTIGVEDGVLFDLGGGSTELTLIRGRKPQKMVTCRSGKSTLRSSSPPRPHIRPAVRQTPRILLCTSWKKTRGSRTSACLSWGWRHGPQYRQDGSEAEELSFQQGPQLPSGRHLPHDLWRSLTLAEYKQRLKFPPEQRTGRFIVDPQHDRQCLFDVTRATA
jgi:exopolyphosphatase/guanosine-5'-triphosphate,3'-diphosphate pyrophosphatase